jgi:hypothetical protein
MCEITEVGFQATLVKVQARIHAVFNDPRVVEKSTTVHRLSKLDRKDTRVRNLL